MFRRFVFASISMATGALAASILLLNPLGWEWIQPVREAVHWTADSGPGLLHGNHHQEETQLWTCGMHPQVVQDHPGQCPICGMDLVPLESAPEQESGERKIKYWVAPMDPSYISDKPGKSPMGMDLVPVYEDESPGGDTAGIVRIDPSFVQNIGVQWVEAERRDIKLDIRTIGTVAYNDRGISLVTVKYAGWIENVQVNYVGEEVREGEVLFEIYSPELVTTEKEFLNAIDYAERMGRGDYPDIRERAESLLESSRERLRNWDMTEDQIGELARTRRPLRTITVLSPADGVVISKMNQSLEGMYVTPGMNLYQIADLSTVWVEAEVFESQLPHLKAGQSASLEFSALPGHRYRGTVRYLYPYLEPKTRTMKVSIELANPGLRLRKDMYADVIFDVPSARRVVAVPEDAVIHSGRSNVVVLSLGDGVFQAREVELGINGDHFWEIRHGIREGERVVTSSQFLIDSESNLRAAVRQIMATREGRSPIPGSTEGQAASVESEEHGGHVH